MSGSLVNTETGELVEDMTAAEAERLTDRIGLRLGTIADNYEAVVPMIREAVERRAWAALGFRSPGEYAASHFGGAMSRLGVEFRQAVVRELSDLGMSTRAIAPVVGASPATVHRDIATASPEAVAEVAPDAITGLNGKTYTRPEPIDHTARAVAAVAEFPDLAYYHERGDLEHTWRLADKLREYRQRGELDERLDTLRRSIAVDRSKRDGTYEPPPPVAEQTCPTCGQTVRN